MLKTAFSINNFNVYSDDENYYFFRALEELDIASIESKTIVDSDGKLNRLITDREFYGATSSFTEDSIVSLEEMVAHIKMHYDKHTNCISFCSNANTALDYGRRTYTDKYVMIKVPKSEMGINVFNAGYYMLDEVNKRINDIIESKELEEYDLQKTFFDAIERAKTQDDLDNIKLMFPEEYVDKTIESYEGGLEFDFTSSRNYHALNDEQNFLKNKIILKLDVLNKQLLKRVSNKFLIQTIGNAFSSLEIIHYKDVESNKIVNISKEMVDILGLLQQLPRDLEYLDEIRQIVINNADINISSEFKYHDKNINDYLDLDTLYDMTSGKCSYKEAINMYTKCFYLAKSRLRTEHSVGLLRQLLGNNPKYEKTLDYMTNHTYGIEPQIVTRLSNDLMQVSESVSLNIKDSEKFIFEFINSLNSETLGYVVDNPLTALNFLIKRRYLLTNLEADNDHKKTWIANSIIDLFDWKSLGVLEKLTERQRNDILRALEKYDILSLYSSLKNEGLNEKKIAYTLFANLIKGNEEINLDETFTLTELEYFIGYNRIKGTTLTLRDYQKVAVKEINKNLSDKQFTSAIMPTGAGKSFVAMAQMNEIQKMIQASSNRDAKMLYLAPNNEILTQLIGYIIEHFNPTRSINGEVSDISIIKEIFPNLTLSTYQILKQDSAKDIISETYDFIIFDELHRTGAPDWKDNIEKLLSNQNENTKILGITATPERDVDFKNMADQWAQRYGYTDFEILKGKHLSFDMDITQAIKLGMVANPKVVNCLYTLVTDGTLDEMKLSIDEMADSDNKTTKMKKYEELRRNIESSDGIEKVIGDNLRSDGKYVVFLPITRKNNGSYVDEDGNVIDKKAAKEVIEDYQTLFRQYYFSYNYLKDHGDLIKSIYNKIKNNIELNSSEIDYLNQERDNILLLSKIDIDGKPNQLNTEINEIADAIIKYMHFYKLDIVIMRERLVYATKDIIDEYSMLSSYGEETNKKQLNKFNNNNNNKIKLMFVMNKLNEGVHVKGVNGIVWLRPLDENSRILYLQQLGRCIYSLKPGEKLKEEDRPLVLDLVNNSLKVKLDKGELEEKKDISNLCYLITWIEDHNGELPKIESKDQEEFECAKMIIELYRKYNKYIDNDELLKEENAVNRYYIEDIIRVGSMIGLWSLDIPELENKYNNDKRKQNEKNMISGFLSLDSVVRDFVEFQSDLEGLEVLSNKFDDYYNLLCKLEKKDRSLSDKDKLKVHEDGSVEIVKMKFENRQIINIEEYFDKSLASVGKWLYKNYKKLSEPQQQRLIDIGYIHPSLIDKNDEFNRTFDKYYGYLLKLKEKDRSLSQNDKLKLHEDGSVEIVKRETESSGKKLQIINREEYFDKSLSSVGYWLYKNYKKLSEPQQQNLIDIGYIHPSLIDKNDELNNTFEKYYGYLLKLKEKDRCLSDKDKLKVHEDGSVEIVKMKFENRQIINREEYYDESLSSVGSWLYRYYEELSDQQQQRLIDIGYIHPSLIDKNDELKNTFEKYYGYLLKLKKKDRCLSSNDKLKLNDDGSVEIVKRETESSGKKLQIINREEYFDKSLALVGKWLYKNYEELSNQQQKNLIDIGYIHPSLIDTNDEFNRTFEKYYGYLLKLKEKDRSLSQHDRLKVNEDGSIEVIKKKTKGSGKNLQIINIEEYFDKSLALVGNWLYKNYKKLSEPQQQNLIDIGYIHPSVRKKKYDEAKEQFHEVSKFDEVSKKAMGEVKDNGRQVP